MRSPLGYILIGCVVGFVISSCCAATMAGLYFTASYRATYPVSSNSGIYGTVTIGPSCPVERIPPEIACAPKPLSVALDVLDDLGQKVSEFVSDSEGNFILSLPPGTYKLVKHSNMQMMPTLQDPGKLVVSAGQYTKIAISFDSGIR